MRGCAPHTGPSGQAAQMSYSLGVGSDETGKPGGVGKARRYGISSEKGSKVQGIDLRCCVEGS